MIPCGETTSRHLTISPCPKGQDPHDCQRSYQIFVPSSLCGAGNKVVPIHNPPLDVLPIVFALHCFGCTTSAMIHLTSMADSHSFVVAVPTGIQKSWNARYCCGYAMQQGVDDVGFLRAVLDDIRNEVLPGVTSPDVAYAVGWSNGGYLAGYAAHLFSAVAPIAGHPYDLASLPYPTEEEMGRQKGQIGLFMHHGGNDPMVRITGCCSNRTQPRCCCSISDQYETCISANDVFSSWVESLAGCQGVSDVPSLTDTERSIVCHTALGCEHGVNATFCVHDKAGHFNRPSFQVGFPMVLDVADFFGRDACEVRGGGMWDGMACRCLDARGGAGTYCLMVDRDSQHDMVEGETNVGSATSATQGKNEPQQNVVVERDGEVLVVICAIMVLGVVMFVVRGWGGKRKFEPDEELDSLVDGSNDNFVEVELRNRAV